MNPVVIEHLPILLLPQRINVICSLTFCWNLPFSPSEILQQEAQETDPRFNLLAAQVHGGQHGITYRL
jgi:hypothetical protein